MPFCTSLRNCLCCAPGCCYPFLSSLRSFFSCTWCPCCRRRPIMHPSDPPTHAHHSTNAAATRTPDPTAAPLRPLRRKTRVPAPTIAPLPALPLHVAEQVEAYQSLLLRTVGRVAWWRDSLDEEGTLSREERERRRVALVREVDALQAQEERVGGLLGNVDGAEAWRREAWRRRVGMGGDLILR
ncbi:hypothetical protein EDC01DRAFT_632851 [Geopyxis carbonaria]|nr:hypothetical protein EDC01DRAFT_632851 [Geopyxis carbonaria]